MSEELRETGRNIMREALGEAYFERREASVNGGAKRDHLGGVRRDRLAAAGLSP